jgi:hypothetical protein
VAMEDSGGGGGAGCQTTLQGDGSVVVSLS